MWLVVVYLLHTWGELALSPVGLSAMSKLAPVRIVGLDDGRLVPRRLGRQLRRPGGRRRSTSRCRCEHLFWRSRQSSPIVAGVVLLALILSLQAMLNSAMMRRSPTADGDQWRSRSTSAKRNFTESPEPAGDDAPQVAAAGRTPRFFCVQKHLASHLHYDFRLEHDGVLLSWAVPKGPSLDPATKRLAMHVEDHPIEYGEFEGVIPSGYGAGIVMLWDRGTWTPEVDDVDAALKKGDLKFTLNGFKLKGSWVLVRTKAEAGAARAAADRSWLLIKHRDDWAGDGRHRRVRAAQRQEQRRLRRHPRSGQPGDLAVRIVRRKGGEAGAMFQKIVERALEMRKERRRCRAHARPKVRRRARARRATKREARWRRSAAAARPRRKRPPAEDATKKRSG